MLLFSGLAMTLDLISEAEVLFHCDHLHDLRPELECSVSLKSLQVEECYRMLCKSCP
jgi:hypothetical protein